MTLRRKNLGMQKPPRDRLKNGILEGTFDAWLNGQDIPGVSARAYAVRRLSKSRIEILVDGRKFTVAVTENRRTG